jgi:hypothetical protein
MNALLTKMGHRRYTNDDVAHINNLEIDACAKNLTGNVRGLQR